jgi:hypothetical protein
MIVRTCFALFALALMTPVGLLAQDAGAAQEGEDQPVEAAALQEGDAEASVETASLQEGEAEPPVAAAAQEEPPRVGDPRLIFEREVFSYPVFGRRNPFKSLVAEGAGPRFEQMRLEMIIYSEDPARSMALLSAGRRGAPAAQPGSAPRGQSARLRVGERWGNVRIVAIRPKQVVVAVEEFGLTEQRTMELPTRGQGGSR